METIKVGDVVKEIAINSGHWLVVELFRETRTTHKPFARLTLQEDPNCEAFVNLENLLKVVT